jgi:hypothetical protein
MKKEYEMNYRVFTISFILALATACTSGPGSEDEPSRQAQRKAEERENSKILIDSLNERARDDRYELDVDSTLRPELYDSNDAIQEPVIVVAGQTQGTDMPRIDDSANSSPSEIKSDNPIRTAEIANREQLTNQAIKHASKQSRKQAGADVDLLVRSLPPTTAALVASHERVRQTRETL